MIAPMIVPSMPAHSSGPRIGSGWKAAAAVVALTAIAIAGNALDDVTLSVERVQGAGWQADGLTLSFDLPQNRAFAKIARVRMVSLGQELRDVRIECPQLELSNSRIACKGARIDANWPGIGSQSLSASVVYGRRDGSLALSLDGIELADGTAHVSASLNHQGWIASTRLQRVPIELLIKMARDFRAPVPSVEGTGLVSLSATARGAHEDVHQVVMDASFADLTANDESGSVASDGLSLKLRGTVRKIASDWQFSIELDSGQGQAYVQPIFLDFGAHAFAASAQGRLHGTRELTLDRFTVQHAKVAQASGRARVELDHERPLRSLQLELASLEFPGAYASYLQPLLLDTNFKAMQTAGALAGALLIEDGVPQSVDLTLSDLTLDDGSRNFALGGLDGHWHWRAEEETQDEDDDARSDRHGASPSSLRWRNGALFGLDLGAGKLEFVTSGRQFRLLQPTRIPLLDGAIELGTFRIRNVGRPKVAFIVDATIQPISVRQLCRAFGWPEFGGRVGGVISKLRMREGVVTLGTTLRAQVFDGNVTISDLRLEQPFGQWPRFYSSIALDNLDLELVTGAFSFGRITGRVSGAIDGLELFNWTPVEFDARLYTPPGDRSKHRISQRAVQNIGNLGGGGAGVTAALSSGFLRFFDDFNYDRLGWSCRLENEVCAMNGVAPAPNGGYYLVKGKGLPRIDVIGSARRVDWPRLVQQLVAATRSQGPVINP